MHVSHCLYHWLDLQFFFLAESRRVNINNRFAQFTRKEYGLLQSFFRQQLALDMDGGKRGFLYADIYQLQQSVGISNKQLLRKHMSNINAKLAPFELQIKPFKDGYFLIRMEHHIYAS